MGRVRSPPVLCVCRRLTAYCQQHGDGSKGPSKALAAHKDGAVLLGQHTHQAEQTALQHCTKRWQEKQSFNSIKQQAFWSFNVVHKARPTYS